MIDPSRDLPPLGHVGYIVENVDESVDRYRRVCGIDNFRVYDYVPDQAKSSGRVVFPFKLRIGIGGFKNEVKIELIQPLAGDTPQAQFLREKGPGLHHLAFYSKQYDDWLAYFKKEGAEITFEAEAEDDIIGYRRSFYARVDGIASQLEISEIAYKRSK